MGLDPWQGRYSEPVFYKGCLYGIRWRQWVSVVRQSRAYVHNIIYVVKKKGTQSLNHLSWFYRVGSIHRFGKAVGEGEPVKGARGDVPGVGLPAGW